MNEIHSPCDGCCCVILAIGFLSCCCCDVIALRSDSAVQSLDYLQVFGGAWWCFPAKTWYCQRCWPLRSQSLLWKLELWGTRAVYQLHSMVVERPFHGSTLCWYLQNTKEMTEHCAWISQVLHLSYSASVWGFSGAVRGKKQQALPGWYLGSNWTPRWEDFIGPSGDFCYDTMSYRISSLSTSHSVPRFKELRSVILMLSAYCAPWLKHSASAEFSYAT